MKEEQKKIKVGKLILQFVIVAYSIILLLVTLFTLACTVKNDNLAFGKYKFYIMRTAGKPEIAKLGDLVIAKDVPAGQIGVGDSIVYGDGKYYYCSNIVEVNSKQVAKKYVVKEGNGVQYQFSNKEIEGKVICAIRDWGSVITFLRTLFGVILFIIFIICLTILLVKIFIKKDEQEQIEDIEQEQLKDAGKEESKKKKAVSKVDYK